MDRGYINRHANINAETQEAVTHMHSTKNSQMEHANEN